MNTDILVRLFWALLILSTGILVFRLINHWLLRRARRAQFMLLGFRTGKPAILYFTTPECVPCKTLQRPALQRVRDQLGETLQVIEINAYDYPQLADQWGVFSIPTTFVLDARATPILSTAAWHGQSNCFTKSPRSVTNARETHRN